MRKHAAGPLFCPDKPLADFVSGIFPAVQEQYVPPGIEKNIFPIYSKESFCYNIGNANV